MADYWSQFEGKSVPLKGLLQWLSREHRHVTDEEGELLEGWNFPVVDSMDLHRWAIAEAVTDEFEYNIEAHDLDRDKRRVDGFWVDDPAKLDLGLENLRKHQQNYVDYGGYIHVEYKIVKRRKQAYEDA